MLAQSLSLLELSLKTLGGDFQRLSRPTSCFVFRSHPHPVVQHRKAVEGVKQAFQAEQGGKGARRKAGRLQSCSALHPPKKTHGLNRSLKCSRPVGIRTSSNPYRRPQREIVGRVHCKIAKGVASRFRCTLRHARGWQDLGRQV